MVATAKLGALDINDGLNYSLLIDIDFTEPATRADTQAFIADHGGTVIEGTDYRNLVKRRFNVRVFGTSQADLFANLSALEKQVNENDFVFEYRYDSTGNANYTDVLYGTVINPFRPNEVRQTTAIVTVELVCMPFWYGDTETIDCGSVTTPGVISVGTVKGDAETDAFISLLGDGAEYGDNLYLGSRKYPVNEGLFSPVKDFSGTADANAFGGQKLVTSVDDNWTFLTKAVVNGLGCSFASTTVGWIVGDNGLIQKTSDGGGTWSTQSSGTNEKLRAVLAVDANTVYVVGDNGTILKTTNGGTNWSALSAPADTGDLYGLSKVNASANIWACGKGTDAGNHGIVIVTTNGTDWTRQVARDNVYGFYAMQMVSATAGIAVTNGDLERTTNGVDWSPWICGWTYSGYGYGISFLTATYGWVSGGTTPGEGRIRRTVNGTSWTKQGPIDTKINALYALSGVAVLAGGEGGIYKTTDGGTIFTNVTPGFSSTINDICYAGGTTFYAVGNGSIVLKSTDSGDTWTDVSDSVAWSLSSPDIYKGDYHFFARVKTADANPGDVKMRVNNGWSGGSYVVNEEVNLANVATYQWVDLGIISIPVVPISPEVDAVPDIALEAIGTGAADFDLDVAVLLPIDGDAIYIKDAATALLPLTIDRSVEAVNVENVIPAAYAGSCLRLYPGDNNIVTLETKVGNSDGLTPVIVIVKYKPRFFSPVQ